MNTPGHVVLNLALLGGRSTPSRTASIIVGAALPDLPIVAFYAWERLVRGATESAIWGAIYFRPEWQLVFDISHSLPLVCAGYLIARATGRDHAAVLCLSMALHSLVDLPLHHDDAHRHFLPLSDWRFASPLSYWDPRHHGAAGALGELVVFLVAGAVVARRTQSRGGRLLLMLIALLYAAGYVMLYVG